MIVLQIILLSGLFSIIFITLHLLFLYLFSFTLLSFSKTVQQNLLPFIIGNLACFYFVKDFEIQKFFYDSFIINLAIFIVYVQFLSSIRTGFTLSLVTAFKKKKKLSHNELIKSYANGRGAKWMLLDRLNGIANFKIIRLNKKIKLTQLGYFLSIILIFLRKILAIKDFG
jgi:hypothetical protein